MDVYGSAALVLPSEGEIEYFRDACLVALIECLWLREVSVALIFFLASLLELPFLHDDLTD